MRDERGEPTLGALPDVVLRAAGPVTAAFRARGCAGLRDAAALVLDIPYGRNRDPENPFCVLEETTGTCSTKHALLARLAVEQAIPGIELRLGIYEMREANTPGVGETLARHGLTSIPEAHCYLVVGGTRVDVTRRDGGAAEPIGEFLFEAVITPDQVGAHKREVHRAFLARAVAEGRFPGHTTASLWAVREACIAALSPGMYEG